MLEFCGGGFQRMLWPPSKRTHDRVSTCDCSGGYLLYHLRNIFLVALNSCESVFQGCNLALRRQRQQQSWTNLVLASSMSTNGVDKSGFFGSTRQTMPSIPVEGIMKFENIISNRGNIGRMKVSMICDGGRPGTVSRSSRMLILASKCIKLSAVWCSGSSRLPYMM